MAFKTTRSPRAKRWPIVRNLIAATLSLTAFQIAASTGPMAQVKAPAKNHFRPVAKPVDPAPSEDIQPFAIGSSGSVAPQLLSLNIDPADAQAAADAVTKAMGQIDAKTASTSSGRAVLQSQGAGQPKRLVALQLYSAKSMAVELYRGNDGSYGYKLAPGATETEDERVSSLPSMAVASSGNARVLAAGSVGLIKASSSTLATSLQPVGASAATLKDLTQALAGFAPNAARIDILKGKTADGTPRVLAASAGEGPGKQFFWWFAPPNQPEGWFDDQGRRLGGNALAEPKPDSRISSPFGSRRYYGRRTGGGFHNGIDYEGRIGEPIYAAADGVINHQGWYFAYGQTVKISHADNFETLYAHMSRFADGVGPGSRVRKGDVIGYVGASGRSTGAHLHFSVIINGQFVDPMPYITEKAGSNLLAGDALVSFKQWQQALRKAAAGADDGSGSRLFRFLQRPQPNPFAQTL
ncbi:MAG: M23 family metallopeptidase [Alphaproteobacteria bacterium]|nr:M23 family metallopeptidase [Alphaproteobacteria bacterium]MBV8413449.1 M23 family metallopeptidase [Alphaproteobacteria bacterium]